MFYLRFKYMQWQKKKNNCLNLSILGRNIFFQLIGKAQNFCVTVNKKYAKCWPCYPEKISWVWPGEICFCSLNSFSDQSVERYIFLPFSQCICYWILVNLEMSSRKSSDAIENINEHEKLEPASDCSIAHCTDHHHHRYTRYIWWD